MHRRRRARGGAAAPEACVALPRPAGQGGAPRGTRREGRRGHGEACRGAPGAQPGGSPVFGGGAEAARRGADGLSPREGRGRRAAEACRCGAIRAGKRTGAAEGQPRQPRGGGCRARAGARRGPAEAQDAAAAAEVAKGELETRVAQLVSDLKASGEELAALKQEREKGAHTLGELQGRFAEKIQELDASKDSKADLELKLDTLAKALESAKGQEASLRKEVAGNEELLKRAAVTQNTFQETVERWTEGLVDIATTIDKELKLLGMEGHEHPSGKNVPPSAMLTSFFKGVVA